MYCRQCGKPVSDNQELCDECMAKQNNTNQVYQTTAQETSSVNNEHTQTNNNNANYTTPNYNYNSQNTQNNNQNQAQYNQYNNNNYVPNPNPKSKIAAGILGILLGALGVHNFYLGYTGKAVAQLLITLISCGTLSFVSAIWGLIEGIMILTGSINTDGQGNPLSD